jgi:mercuric ion transport protein
LRGVTTKAERVADIAGPLGAVFAALCCLGVPFIVAGLAAIGLSILRADPFLWPLMIVSLIVALWGMWRGWRTHGSKGPLLVGALSGVALVAGVIFVHGFPARQLIYAGSAGIVAATIWNVSFRTQCERRLRENV